MRLGHLRRAPSNTTRLLIFFWLSIALMVVDHRSHYLQAIRSTVAVFVYPFQLVALLPEKVGSGVINFFAAKKTLREENQRLHEEQLRFQVRLQKLEALEIENTRLRRLLGAAAHAGDKAVIAELLDVSMEPFTQKILVNKGSVDGIHRGQPVIDAEGIMGQVTQVTPLTSTATLITDPSHAIPVQVQRNGLRAILFGTGSLYRLELPNLAPLADIREKDLLITSGMGGRFPAGFPVARVTKISADPNEAFLAIEAEPVARLGHSKEVLLIWPGTEENQLASQAHE